jgi:hypothetical protein
MLATLPVKAQPPMVMLAPEPFWMAPPDAAELPLNMLSRTVMVPPL